MIADKPTGKWAVAFIRVSTEMQKIEGQSVQQQVESAIAQAKTHGQEIVAVYGDPGISASKVSIERRPGAQALMDDIKASRVGAVYMYKRDRFARQGPDWFSMVKLARTHDLKIYFTCPEEPPFGTGIYGNFTEQLLIAVAELEAQTTSLRVKDNILSRFSKGQWVGGPLPFGLMKNVEGKIEKHPTEAPLVEEIFRLAREEGLGGTRIADRLNDERPGSYRGRHWTRHAITRILRNKVYAGYLTHTGSDSGGRQRLEVASTNVPMLVDEKWWEQVAAMRQSRTLKKGSPAGRHYASKSLLRGLVVCGVCGHPMRTQRSVRKYNRKDGLVSEYRARYFLCVRGHAADGCTYRSNVREYLIEDAVLEACQQVFLSLDVAEIIRRAKAFRESQLCDLRANRNTAVRELAHTDSVLTQNQAHLEAAASPAETAHYRDRIRRLLSQKAEQEFRVASLEEQIRLSSEHAIVEQQVIDALNTFADRFDNTPVHKKRPLIIDLVQQVTWRPDQRQVDVIFKFNPSASETQPFVVHNATPGFPGVTFCITKVLAPLGFHAPAPFGYKIHDSLLSIDEAQAPVIRRIFELVQGRWTWKSIAERINKEFPEETLGKYWTYGRVRWTAGNPHYCGYRRAHRNASRRDPSGYVPTPYYPAIIQFNDWLRVQEEIEERIQRLRPR
jgi:DNA invertase Pin-like site-specific DNA recombinase